MKFVVSNPSVTCAMMMGSEGPILEEVFGAVQGPMPDEKLRVKILEASKG